MIETVKEEEKKKAEDAKNEHQAFREDTKNKNLEETNHMKMLLDGRQTKYYNELEQMHQKYTSDTAKKTDEHSQLFELNKEMSKIIDRLVRQIANKKV